jgi:hypothetical protein
MMLWGNLTFSRIDYGCAPHGASTYLLSVVLSGRALRTNQVQEPEADFGYHCSFDYCLLSTPASFSTKA